MISFAKLAPCACRIGQEAFIELYLDAFTTGQYAQHITPEQARETLVRLMAERWGIIASDYIWTTRQTAHRAWLGGYKKDGEPVTAPDALKKVLAPWFEQEREPEELLLTMLETSRLYTVSRQQVVTF